MTTTYPYAWGSTRLSMAELEAKTTIQNAHPEFWRRLKAMLEAGGGRLGVGTVWRSSDVQRNVFLERHYVVSSGGCCGWDGRRYQLRKGMAHAAPPGKSFHEGTFHGYAQACDAVGDLAWMHSVEADYGLKDFRTVGSEPWHIQLVEIANSVTQWKAAGSPQPSVWKLPHEPAPPTNSLFGPDVSAWQEGLLPPDPHDIDFGIARATNGEAIDPTVDNVIVWCRQRKVPFAAYHFVYECATHPATVQAAAFHHAVGGDRSIPCMIDWESDTDDNCHPGRPQHPTWDDVLDVAAAIRALGHEVPLLYTGKWYWTEQGSPPLTGHGLDLVNAHYGAKPWPTGDPGDVYAACGGDGGPGWTGYGGLDPVLWQYTCQATWGNKQVDFNAYRGDTADLDRWFTMWTEQEDDVTDEDIEKIAQRAAQLVWNWKANDIVTDAPMAMQTMVRYTRSDVNKVVNRM